MKVLALLTDAFGGSGGIAQYNRDFLEALIACNAIDEVTVLPRLALPPICGLPPRVEQKMPVRNRFLYAAAALFAARSGNFGVVFCGHVYMAPLAQLAARIAGAKLVIQLHGVEAWGLLKPSQRRAIEAADMVLSVSRFTRNAILKQCDLAPERIAVIPNTVNNAFSPGDGSVLRLQWGLVSNTVLMTVGRLDAKERYKGHDRIIKLMPELKNFLPDLVYVIVGEGDDRHRLEALANSIGCSEAVQFTGAVDFETLKLAYQLADLFVMPSTGEGFGIVYLEAMASGTPALGLNVAGAADALVDGELGIICHEDELSEKIVDALQAKHDSNQLHTQVGLRFGENSFRASIADQVLRWEA